MRRHAALALAWLLAPGALLAQGAGHTAGLLLEVPPTARAMGLGGAYTAVVGDAGSVFVNPAGMAPVRHLALDASFEENFLGARLTTAAGLLRVGRFDLGVGAMLMEFGGDSVIVPSAPGSDAGTPTGELLTAYSFVLVGATAYRRGMISLGASGKLLRERVDDGGPDPVAATGVTGDLGLAIAVFDLMALGAVVQNVAGSVRASGAAPSGLPRTTRLGFTMNFIDPQGTLRLLTTTDWVAPPGGDSYWAVGLEGGAVAGGVGVVARIGVALGRARSDREPLSLGGGLQLRGLRLDYAFQGWGATGAASHRFGVRWIP